MAQASTSSAFPFCDERTRKLLELQWQRLRRNEDYKRDTQECLRNLQALHDQWVTERQMLGPHPVLSTNAFAVATEIVELLRINRAQTYLACPPRLEVKRPLLLDWVLDNDFGGLFQALSAEERHTVAKELIAYWEWEDEDRRLNDHIIEHTIFIKTLRSTTHVFCSWDAPLHYLLAEVSKLPKLYQDTLYKFAQICCNPTILERYPPLTMLLQQRHILLPLDPEIPALPLRAALEVFPVPHTRPYDFKVAYPRTEPSVTFTIKAGPGATKKDIHAGLDPLLSFAMPRLDHCIGYRPKRVKRKWEKEKELEYYPTIFRIYDLHCAGVSDADIARQVFVKDFQNIKKPYDFENDEYKKIMLRVAYYIERAKELINNI